MALRIGEAFRFILSVLCVCCYARRIPEIRQQDDVCYAVAAVFRKSLISRAYAGKGSHLPHVIVRISGVGAYG